MAAHEITMKGTTPDGVKVQVEDWSKVYEGATWGVYTLAAYAPIVNVLAFTDKFSRYLYMNNDTARVSFNFQTMDECAAAFDAVTSGTAKLSDYASFADAMEREKGYLAACGLEAATCA